jgi:pyruvate dehydrogenase E2 component (dihydrolipoamide acetyltransferase)
MAERTFLLPDLGEGLEDATIATWLVREGETVVLNQPLVEVETAKATVEIPSPYAGRVKHLHGDTGTVIVVGNALVTFEVEGTETGPSTEPGSMGPPPTAATPKTGGGGPLGSGAVAATPAVRKLAKDLGVDLGAVVGSGPDGRVTREDVERAAGGGAAPTGDAIPVSPTRRAIVAALSRAAAVPQVTTFRTVDCTALEAVRADLGTSPLPVFVRALAEVCAAHPLLNAEWAEDRIVLHREVHVGIATATERGLVVPVVTGVGARGIGDVAAEIKRVADAARAGSLGAGRATISVSNTGSYGSEAGTPILNPPNAVTVALGVIEPRALVVEGRVEARPACTLSLTFDHRVLDGADAGRALTDLVGLLEDPARLRTLPR